MSQTVTLAWPRLFIEGVTWICDLLLGDEGRELMMFMPLRSTGKERVDAGRQGAKEVLDLLLSDDVEDDIFVRMMAWGTLILMLVIWSVKRFDVVEPVL